MVMFKKLPVVAVAVVVAAMSVAPASARNRPVVHNVTVDNSNYGVGTVTGPVLYPNGSNVEMYGTAYVVPKSVIAYWPTYGWYRQGN
jgi:hypothetical protein